MLNSRLQSQKNDINSTYWKTLIEEIKDIETVFLKGRVSSVEGELITADFIHPPLGTECLIGEEKIASEVISTKKNNCQLIAYENSHKIKVNDEVIVYHTTLVDVCHSLLGRVVDPLGRSLDGKGRIRCSAKGLLHAPSIPVLDRPLIKEQLITNIKVIDMFTPIGKGQRIGIFSGSGVGKSSLLGMIARHSNADINVVALVGERGREVKELIEYDIGVEGMKKTVVVAASSEESASMRLRAVNYACAIAEYFRDFGNQVTLLVDSFTRVAHAQREIGVMRGEAPIARGFPTSIYRVLPQIVERCGTSPRGSITGIFTVLVEGDDEDEPVTDIVRGIVDGHIILNRDLAQRMQYPAVHIPSSLSRVAKNVQKSDLYDITMRLRERLGMYEEAKDIINAGVYSPGSNRLLDVFLGLKPEFDRFIRQRVEEVADFSDTENQLREFSERI